MQDRRYAAVYLADDLVEMLLGNGFETSNLKVRAGIPNGAKLVCARVQDGILQLTFEHSSFVSLPVGAQPPVLEMRVETLP